jgi:hypothetical protein
VKKVVNMDTTSREFKKIRIPQKCASGKHAF